MKVINIPTNLKSYQGSGKAWAAIKDGQVIALKYMGDFAHNWVKKTDKRYKEGYRWAKNPEADKLFAKYREECRAELLSLGGEVAGGMASCYEFCYDP